MSVKSLRATRRANRIKHNKFAAAELVLQRKSREESTRKNYVRPVQVSTCQATQDYHKYRKMVQSNTTKDVKFKDDDEITGEQIALREYHVGCEKSYDAMRGIRQSRRNVKDFIRR